MHSRLIGIASPSGDLSWYNWWEFPDHLLSVAHVLSRGASWYFWNSDLSTSLNMGNRAWNQMSFSYASNFRSRLRFAGWNVKKEDRGKRFVLLPTSLISSWFDTDMKKRGFVKSGKPSRSNMGTRIYFLPKTHKPLPLRGRLVEACGKRGPPLHLPTAPWSIRNTDTAIRWFQKIGVGDPSIRFSGDIESMFPSIPVPELCEMLRSRGSPAAASVLKQVLDAYRLSFNGQLYAVPVGLPIGHPWSPALADFYISVKEEPFVASLPSDVVFGRYADDTLFSVPLDSSVTKEQVCLAYEKAVAPLKVTWQFSSSPEEAFKFLDASFKGLPAARPPFMRRVFNEAPRPHLGPFQPPGGCVPPTYIMTSILGRALRVGPILRTSWSKWKAAHKLLLGEIQDPVADQFLVQLTDGEHARYIQGAINFCVRRLRRLENVATSPSTEERPRLWLTFSPFWLSATGKRKLTQVRKHHQIRWNLCGIRRLQHLV